MKAVVFEKYGSPDVLELKEIPRPAPEDNEVLVKIHCASVNAFDWHILRSKPFFVRFVGFGVFKPKLRILGVDIAGTVEAVGKNVDRFKPGDEIFGDVSSCGCGAYAEYVCADQKYIAPKPNSMSFEEAAAVPLAAVTALQGLRDKGKIKSGQKILINGASGGVGTFAVQIAKYFGADVTAVCSTGKMELVHSLGADHLIDYTKEDFTKSGRQYDLIYAANGYNSIFGYLRSLTREGIYVLAGGEMAQMYQAVLLGSLLTMRTNKKILNYVARPNRDDLLYLTELINAGKLKSVIDRRYKLSEVPDAIRYVEEGHAPGKVMINMEH